MGCCGGPRCAADFDGDREGLSEEDLCRFGGDEAECPHCGAEMYADATLCPRCGMAVGDPPRRGGKRIVLMLIGVIALITFLGVSWW